MRHLIYVAIVGCLVGCSSGRFTPTQQTKTTIKDSVWTDVKKIQRDTIITIPGDTTFIEIPIYELSEVPVIRTNGRSVASVRKVNDNILVSCECLEYKQKIEYLETIISQYEKIQELTEIKITTPVPYVPWYYKTLAWIGGAALLFGIGMIALKFLKPI